MTKKITEKEIDKISDLIKVHIPDKDKAHFVDQLNNVLEAADVIKETETEGIRETSQTHGLVNITAEDSPEKGLDIQKYPNRKNLSNGYFVVKRVI